MYTLADQVNTTMRHSLHAKIPLDKLNILSITSTCFILLTVATQWRHNGTQKEANNFEA